MTPKPTADEIARNRDRLDDLDHFDPHRDQTDPYDRTDDEDR